MKISVDLHIHSCLSPCGDNDMTPYNIANMAAIAGLDTIALTDHNSVKNCRATVKAGEEAGVLVIPGMELCTAEEIHAICLFQDLPSAEAFGEHVEKTLPPVLNNPDVFGEQLVMDHMDTVTGTEPVLLVTASGIRIDQVYDIVKEYGGTCYPAHIDRSSYSILASLGSFPPDLPFKAAEFTALADREAVYKAHPHVAGLNHITSSDAHDLSKIGEAGQTLDVSECSAKAIIDFLEKERTV